MMITSVKQIRILEAGSCGVFQGGLLSLALAFGETEEPTKNLIR
jgi:hypothetical protein